MSKVIAPTCRPVCFCPTAHCVPVLSLTDHQAARGAQAAHPGDQILQPLASFLHLSFPPPRARSNLQVLLHSSAVFSIASISYRLFDARRRFASSAFRGTSVRQTTSGCVSWNTLCVFGLSNTLSQLLAFVARPRRFDLSRFLQLVADTLLVLLLCAVCRKRTRSAK
jgi:hypothetical protein